MSIYFDDTSGIKYAAYLITFVRIDFAYSPYLSFLWISLFMSILSPIPKIRLEVSDSGCGISEMDQQRIFERFYRVEDSVHTEVGTGLGLSIVKGIVDKHGSDIRMASELNTGTTFWFELPLENSDADQLLLKSARKNWEIENDKSLVT